MVADVRGWIQEASEFVKGFLAEEWGYYFAMGSIRAGLSFIKVKVYSVLVTGIFGMLQREREENGEEGGWGWRLRGGPSIFFF